MRRLLILGCAARVGLRFYGSGRGGERDVLPVVELDS